MLHVFAVLSGLSATRKLMPDEPGEGTIVRFLTFAETPEDSPWCRQY
jgi:hypothetical protein